MERFLPRIWVFVMAFGLGISISAAWRIYTLPAYSLPEPSEPVIEPVDYSNRAVMEMPNGVNASEGPQLVEGEHNCGAAGADGQIYNYNDGGWVRTRCRRFKTSWAATREYLNRLRSGTIKERSVITDGNGSHVGEEILIIAPRVDRIRIKGRILCEVEASSLYHLNWFQKPR